MPAFIDFEVNINLRNKIFNYPNKPRVSATINFIPSR